MDINEVKKIVSDYQELASTLERNASTFAKIYFSVDLDYIENNIAYFSYYNSSYQEHENFSYSLDDLCDAKGYLERQKKWEEEEPIRRKQEKIQKQKEEEEKKMKEAAEKKEKDLAELARLKALYEKK